eukprot:364020-Chlamydomonas_euryale.AAC.5
MTGTSIRKNHAATGMVNADDRSRSRPQALASARSSADPSVACVGATIRGRRRKRTAVSGVEKGRSGACTQHRVSVRGLCGSGHQEAALDSKGELRKGVLPLHRTHTPCFFIGDLA